MGAVPDTGCGLQGVAGSGWAASVAFASQGLAHLGVDPDRAEPLLRERGLLDADGSSPSERVPGAASANGSCRLLAAADGWVAVNLPRPDDLDLLPAWLGVPEGSPSQSSAASIVPWESVSSAISRRGTGSVVAAGQELGLAVAMVSDGAADHGDEQLLARGTTDPARPFLRTALGEPGGQRAMDGVRVVDLSSLWAGPLCSRFLAEAGAEVISVESPTRPDGTRVGDPALFDRLHTGKRLVQVPFVPGADGAALRALLAGADVIIEGSRPRAFERLGLDPAAFLAARPGVVWLSITAYGRTGPWCNRVGFGDDAAAAAGLVDRAADGAPSFVGDAIADPLTGLVAAALISDAVASGGGVLLDVALREVARSVALGAEVAW